MKNLKDTEYKQFEDIKHLRADGSEYWLARELAEVLDYAEWRNFTKVIDKAMIACKVSDRNVFDHFVDVNKMVDTANLIIYKLNLVIQRKNDLIKLSTNHQRYAERRSF